MKKKNLEKLTGFIKRGIMNTKKELEEKILINDKAYYEGYLEALELVLDIINRIELDEVKVK